jgi:hypothetical protein
MYLLWTALFVKARRSSTKPILRTKRAQSQCVKGGTMTWITKDTSDEELRAIAAHPAYVPPKRGEPVPDLEELDRRWREPQPVTNPRHNRGGAQSIDAEQSNIAVPGGPNEDQRSQERQLDMNAREYDADNPAVWEMFESLALALIGEGLTRYGANTLVGRIRYEARMHTADRRSPFGVNNDYAPYFARKFARKHPEHANFFETRVLKGGGAPEDAETG